MPCHLPTPNLSTTEAKNQLPTAPNFPFTAVLVPCSVQSVRAQLSHKWLIPPSGRVSALAHAVLLSVTAVLPFSCSNLQ